MTNTWYSPTFLTTHSRCTVKLKCAIPIVNYPALKGWASMFAAKAASDWNVRDHWPIGEI